MANLKGFTKVGSYQGKIYYRGDAKLVSCGQFQAHVTKKGKAYTWLTLEVINGFGEPVTVSCIDYSKEESNIPPDDSVIAVKYTEGAEGDLLFIRCYDDRMSSSDFGHNKIVSSLQAKIDALKASIDPESHEAAKATRGAGRSSRKSAII